jgi:hypothetical protein
MKVMGVRRLWVMGAGCAVGLLALFAAIAAEVDQLRATIDKPATVTATPAKALESTSADQPAPSVTLHVTGYQPPKDGAVAGVVKIQKPDGSEQELGTFGVFPQTAFKTDSSNARRYSFTLPKELASGPVKLKVDLVPIRGTGEGAQLEVGRAEVR